MIMTVPFAADASMLVTSVLEIYLKGPAIIALDTYCELGICCETDGTGQVGRSCPDAMKEPVMMHCSWRRLPSGCTSFVVVAAQ